jgi:hypothetical protein
MLTECEIGGGAMFNNPLIIVNMAMSGQIYRTVT